jgi:hypothetical protein
MIDFSPALASDITSLGVTKQAYSNTIISYLTANRRLVAKHNGTIAINATVTGDFKTSGGNIVSIGQVGATSVHNSLDLTTGTNTIEITSGSNYMRGTLGLSKEKQIARGLAAGKTLEQATAAVVSYDFTLTDNPTSLTGLGVMNSLNIQAPTFLPSGTGPAAPELDADAPVVYEVLTYPVNDNTPVSLGHGYITERDPDMVFDRDYIAKQIGDVRMMRSAEGAGVIIGSGGECFRIAPTLMVINSTINADNSTKPVYRMRFLSTPHGRWQNFPFRGTFDISTDTTILPAHKIVLKRADMSVIDVIEMYSTRVNNVPGSGKPVNFSNQSITRDAHPELPIQPLFTCQMSHSYCSANIKHSSYMNHLFPGVESEALDWHNVRNYDAGPEQWPVITGNYLADGLGSWRIAPKWSSHSNESPNFPRPSFDTTIIDPLFVNPSRDNFRSQQIGYGFEPGSTCHHSWFMSPGGSRHDRAMWADVVVRYVSDPTSIRPHGAVPMKELYKNWMLGYHNEGDHYPTNPELGKTIPKENVLYGLNCYNDTYYSGGNEDFRPDIPNTAVRLLTIGNSQHYNTKRDFKGRIFTNEYQRDDQHSIPNAANMTYFGNDPMGALEARDSYNSHMMCAFNMTQGFLKDSFLCREHAWHFKNLIEMWIVGNNNPNGLSSADMEFIAGRHLEQVYDVMMPYMDPALAATNNEALILQTFGQIGNIYTYTPPADTDGSVGYVETGIISLYDSKQYYFCLALMLAKQSGFYDRMKAYSSKASQALDLIMLCMNKSTVDCFVECKGRADRLGFNAHANFIFPLGQRPSPLNWQTITAQTGTPKEASVGLTDFIHNAAGGFDAYIEGYNTQHFRAQWPIILKRFFPEISYPKTDEAIAIIRGFYQEVEARKSDENTNSYWHWRFSHMGFPKAPAKVGPPVVTN